MKMFNSDLLRDKIKAAGFRIDYVADQLQISYQAFWNKMNKKTEFTAAEIGALKDLLHLSDADVMLIFFTEKVD